MPDSRQSSGDVLSPEDEHDGGVDSAADSGVAFVPVQPDHAKTPDDAGSGGHEPEQDELRPPHRPTTTRMPSWALAGLATLLVAGLGIVAPPLLLAQRAEAAWEATVVRLPEGFNGLPRNSGGQVAALLGTAPKQPRLAGYQGGLYGNGTGQTVFIIAARSTAPLSEEQQESLRRDFVENFADRAGELTLRERDPGTLGGYFGCGHARGVTTCLGTEVSSLVAVLVVKPMGDPVATALAAREATVRRH